MKYYDKCETVKLVQVIWSDQLNKAPIEWLKTYSKGKFEFEIHSNDSLSNRFRVLKGIPTEVTYLYNLKHSYYN